MDRPGELGVAQVRDRVASRIEQRMSVSEPPCPDGQDPGHDRVIEQRDAFDDGSIALVEEGPGLVPAPEVDER